jgi:hypothetical protein
VSAESYAEQRFNAVKADPVFAGRVADYGTTVDALVVVADSTSVGEVLARLGNGRVVAVLDEDAPHGFALARIAEVER